MLSVARSAYARTRFVAAPVLALLVAACGGTDVLTESRAVASISFPSTADTLVVGTRSQLRVTLRDRDGEMVTGAALDWQSADSTIAVVSESGMATALRVGTTGVVASAGGRSASLRLVVRPVPVAALAFEAPPAELPAGSVVQLTVTARDQVGAVLAGRTVSYGSSAAGVASVGSTGVLTALGAGETTITAECEGRTATFTLRVRVVPVASIELVPSSVAVQVGQAVQLYATLRDAAGQPLPSRTVTFRTTNAAVASVNVDGVVQGMGEGTASVVAELDGRSATAPVAVSPAVGAAPGPVVAPLPSPVAAPALSGGVGDGSYAIRVQWVGAPDPRASSLVSEAVDRWRSVISGDLSNATVDLQADDCMEGQPASRESVDDLLILVRVLRIDGSGGTLARAGPCLVRTSNGLPIVGMVELDEEDLGRSSDIVRSVLTHEFGHVLGIGTLWEYKGLLHGKNTEDPRFLGATALSAYTALGGTLSLMPVENAGGVGTRNGHWRESLFRTELMTGWINAGFNQLSTMTVASLRDLGYAVNLRAADAFTLPATGLVSPRIQAGPGIEVGEELIRPRFEVDAAGRKRRLPDR